MIKKLLLLALLAVPFAISAQTYNEDMLAWRQAYKMSLLRGNHPMKQADTAYLRYFEPDEDYRVKAKFVPVKGGKSMDLKTVYGGKQEKVTEYGYADFELMGMQQRLHIYKLAKSNGGQNYELFIPFTDPTNSMETYRGGRYLNITEKDFSANKVTIDFNKSYNPRTAYVKGYPAIIPPAANKLKLDINAGEKAYGIDPGY